MTGYTVHTGSTEKFAEGWDQIFKTGPKSPSSKTRKPAMKRKAATRAKGRKRAKAR